MAPAPDRLRGGTHSTPTSSYNWAGYVQQATARDTFTSVTDTFNVPTPTSSDLGTGQQLVAAWVGIGGYTYLGTLGVVDPTLVQAGIQVEVKTTKRRSGIIYSAWTEDLPHPERRLPLVVAAGDTVTATVSEISANTWVMEVHDVTTGKTKHRTLTYDASGLSAEAILETPCLGNSCSSSHRYAPLAPTTNVTFYPGYASISAPGTPPVEQPLLGTIAGLPPGDFGVLTEVALDGGGSATPSAPNATDDGFTVADGTEAPPPPTG